MIISNNNDQTRPLYGSMESASGSETAGEEEEDAHAITTDEQHDIRTFEEVLEVVKPLGMWQWMTYMLIGYFLFCSGMINSLVGFYQLDPTHWCRVPELEGAWTQEQIRNVTSKDECRIPDVDYGMLANVSFDRAYLNISGTEPTRECKEWTFDPYPLKTIISDYQLVCDRKWFLEHSYLINSLGSFVGSFIGGYLSDRFGRKWICMSAFLLNVVLCVAEAFSPNFEVFVIIGFVICLIDGAASVVTFCLAMEITTARYLQWVGGLFWVPYGLGYTFVAPLAYWTRDWRMMYIWSGAPLIIPSLLSWLIPESPRWLLIHGRTKDAEKTLRFAAKMNCVEMPAYVNFEKIAANISDEEQKTKEESLSIHHIFEFSLNPFRLKYPILVWRYCNIFFNSFAQAVAYYGLVLRVGREDGDVFTLGAISGAIELPAYAITVPLLWWGRRFGTASTLIGSGVLLSISLLTEGTARSTLVLIAKLLVTGSFSMVGVYTVELMPTSLRASGYAVSYACTYVGAMAAPYIAGLDKIGESWWIAPYIVMGFLTVSAGLLLLCLPETKGKPLPENLEDVLPNYKSKDKPEPSGNHIVC